MAIIGAGKIKYLRHQRNPKYKMLDCYAERDNTLSLCGYSCYQEYLASEDWKKIRERKLRNRPNCLGCKGKADQVHHLYYTDKVLLGLDGRGIVSLCRNCHKLIEFDGERKRTVDQANEVLIGLALSVGNKGWVDDFQGFLVWRSRQPKPKKRRKKRR